MKYFPLILVLGLCLVHAQAHAQQPVSLPGTPAPTPGKPASSLKGKLIYKPVGLGFPVGRVDAGSRGDGDEVASLYVIAPEHVGFTARSQPSLYWFQTGPATLPFEISVLKPNEPKPVLLIRRPEATTGGFHHLDLADHGVTLEPGVDYQWVVALVRDPQSRSRDIVSSGWIRYDTTRNTGSRSDASAYASSGLWYDAVTALFGQLGTHPRDSQLIADRRDLFTQVGLPPLPDVPKRQP
jgi:hypothetical protein